MRAEPAVFVAVVQASEHPLDGCLVGVVPTELEQVCPGIVEIVGGDLDPAEVADLPAVQQRLRLAVGATQSSLVVEREIHVLLVADLNHLPAGRPRVGHWLLTVDGFQVAVARTADNYLRVGPRGHADADDVGIFALKHRLKLLVDTIYAEFLGEAGSVLRDDVRASDELAVVQPVVGRRVFVRHCEPLPVLILRCCSRPHKRDIQCHA
jgi:hypothetical protein